MRFVQGEFGFLILIRVWLDFDLLSLGLMKSLEVFGIDEQVARFGWFAKLRAAELFVAVRKGIGYSRKECTEKLGVHSVFFFVHSQVCLLMLWIIAY